MTDTPCPSCQASAGIRQGEINAKFGGNFERPVVYYAQLRSVAFGRGLQTAPDGRIIKAKKLEEIAAK